MVSQSLFVVLAVALIGACGVGAASNPATTALHAAVSIGNRPAVKSALDAGADINAIGDGGQTPLVCMAVGCRTH